MEKLLYIHRVADMLDCSRPMVYKLIYEGKIKAIRLGKRGIRISEPSLEAFLEENTIVPDEFHTA
ncbi:helix-turn-helix domain-containing protein [Thermodesulfobacteriota bacterium]